MRRGRRFVGMGGVLGDLFAGGRDGGVGWSGGLVACGGGGC